MRLERVLARTSIGVMLIFGLMVGVMTFVVADYVDFILYRDAAAHWLATGRFYDAGIVCSLPIGVSFACPVVYPPTALFLLVPFTVLPAQLWWIVPITVTGWAVWRMRPARWTWPLMAVCVCWPWTVTMVWTGNPGMWILAAIALGCLYRWPAVFVLLKPSLAPFALVGIRSRSWWLALLALGLASIPFGGLWVEWVRTLFGWQPALWYSLPQAVTMLLPVFALAGRDGRPLRLPRVALRLAGRSASA